MNYPNESTENTVDPFHKLNKVSIGMTLETPDNRNQPNVATESDNIIIHFISNPLIPKSTCQLLIK